MMLLAEPEGCPVEARGVWTDNGTVVSIESICFQWIGRLCDAPVALQHVDVEETQ